MGRKTNPFPEHEEWTTARFFSFLRSHLRKAWQRWPEKWKKKDQQKVPSLDNKRKWDYICEDCLKRFGSKDVEVHHIYPIGQLRDFEDLPIFVSRLFVSSDKLKLLCITCHKEKG